MSLTVSILDIVNRSSSGLLGKHESWERVELGFIAKVLNGFAFSSANFSKERGIPLIRIRDISDHFTEVKYDSPYDELYLVESEDLLVGMDGDFNCALWKGSRGLLNQRVCKIEVYQNFFNKKFLFYALPGYLKAINDATSSMTVKHLSSSTVEEIPLPLPPLPEQSRIVAAIEQQFSRLDSAVASLQSAQARTKQYRTSLLKSAVEGELTKEWRTEHPAQETGAQLLARILSERRKRWEEEQLAKMREKGNMLWDDKWKQAYKEPQGPDLEHLPEPLELPDGWCWASLEQLTSAIRPICYGILMPKENIPDGVPYVKVKDMKGDRIDVAALHRTSPEIAAAYSRASLKPDDLLLAIRGTYGRVAEVPDELDGANITQDTARLEISSQLSQRYVAIHLRSYVSQSFFQKVARGVAVKGVNIADVKLTPILLPPLAEQAQIVAEVEEKLSNLEQMEATIEHCLRRAEHERQSILREAFAGRLVAQDPSDEPASVLLARIREERKQRAAVEEKRRRESKVEMARQPKKRKKIAPLYDVLVDAGGELTPEELYKRSEDQRKEQPEQERDEAFYIELDTEEAASLIAEARPAYNEVVLRALEQEEEDEESEEAVKEQVKQNIGQRKTLWDV